MALLRRVSEFEPTDLVQQVALNLSRILNTSKRHGSVLADYGLGDYDEWLNTSRAVDTLQDEIRTSISSYEPRLSRPQIVLLGRGPGGWLHFQLDASLAEQPVSMTISFDVVFRCVRVTVLR